jgi:hypothetical protein
MLAARGTVQRRTRSADSSAKIHGEECAQRQSNCALFLGSVTSGANGPLLCEGESTRAEAPADEALVNLLNSAVCGSGTDIDRLARANRSQSSESALSGVQMSPDLRVSLPEQMPSRYHDYMLTTACPPMEWRVQDLWCGLSSRPRYEEDNAEELEQTLAELPRSSLKAFFANKGSYCFDADETSETEDAASEDKARIRSASDVGVVRLWGATSFQTCKSVPDAPTRKRIVPVLKKDGSPRSDKGRITWDMGSYVKEIPARE